LNGVDDPQSFSHRFATVNGIRMHYVEEGDGPLVILLHGYPFLWYLWRHQIKALAAAGYRVVAPDQRGYGQTDGPEGVESYDMTRVVGDVVGLMNAVGSESAVLVGQDFGSPVAYHVALMRPDLVRGVVMMCAPPSPRAPISPWAAARLVYDQDPDIVFYQELLSQPETAQEIMRDVRRFLLGAFASTSGSASDDKQFQWAWKPPTTLWDAIPVPDGGALPPYLSQQAFDYYVAGYTRTGIQSANNATYAAIETSWANTSFLDGAVAQQPALFLTGERDPTLKPRLGFDRQGPAIKALPTAFRDMRDILTIPGVGHTPPEEAPDEVNAIVLKFLNDIGY
jgi:pimeloyl-ACP methyl ester carboxylesterase